MASRPKTKAQPLLYFKFTNFNVPGLSHEGVMYRKFEFKGMANGGYIIKATLADPNSKILRTLVEQGYFQFARVSPVEVKFQILAGKGGQPPETATKMQSAFITSMRSHGDDGDEVLLEFIGIDPPSWYLNAGDAAGRVYKGRISDVIRQTVNDYAPPIELDVSPTADSKENKWWMMRQDPKTFINSLLDWSSSITGSKTHWIVEPDGYKMKLSIHDQGEMNSVQRAYYKRTNMGGIDTVKSWELLADNALSLVNTKLITAGLSAISGRYLDKITDRAEQIVYAKDKTTPRKQIADVNQDESFDRPPEGSPPQGDYTVAGWTAITGIPELYSAGDIGLNYDEYIDGRARGLYLNMLNMLMRIRLRVIGHGEWSDCKGLGIDTIYLKWLSAADQKMYFLCGPWLIYGFEHIVGRLDWSTDLYLARFDWNAYAQKVGGGD